MTAQDIRQTAGPDARPAARVRPDEPPPWGAEALDLDRYLARIGYQGPVAPSAAALFAVHRAHVAAIAFENIDVALGRAVPLDLPALQRKLVDEGRGGYCFEQNLLFAAVLERFGFRVERHLARVRRGRTALRYRAHAFLRVTGDEGVWLADAGFGDEGLLVPIAFKPGAVSQTGGRSWRLTADEDRDQWVLQALHPEGWFDLYGFRLERHHLPDFEVSNHFTATHPRSTFVGRLIVMHSRPYARRTLVDREFVLVHADGAEERTELDDAGLLRVLDTEFGLRLAPRDAELLLAHLPVPGAGPLAGR
jgi:N-hydroxyarylamine O-acetyltransferase